MLLKHGREIIRPVCTLGQWFRLGTAGIVASTAPFINMISLLLIVQHSGGLPLATTKAPQTNIEPAINIAVQFMQRYGYLEGPSMLHPSNISGALIGQDSLSTGIQAVQKFAGISVTGVLDTDTIKLMSTPRCGNPDLDPFEIDKRSLSGTNESASGFGKRRKRFAIGGQGWKKRHLTYHISKRSTKLGSKERIAADLKTAFSVWSKYTQLSFTELETEQDLNGPADILIDFGSGPHGDEFPFDGPGLVLAHAFYPYGHGTFGGDIHFDDDESWSTKEASKRLNSVGPEDAVDFFSVAVHEIGHSLGLAHSPVQDSVMYPYYRGEADNANLGYDDILGVYQQYIYSQSMDEFGESTPPKEATTTEAWVSFNGDDDDFDDNSNDQPGHNGDEGSNGKGGKRDGAENSPKTEDGTGVPDLCAPGTVVDTVTNIRGELFVFKDKYLWRYRKQNVLMPEYPVEFRRMFPSFPESVAYIDAVYVRPSDQNIVFFSGDQFWVSSDGLSFLPNSPQSLKELGLPDSIGKIDAAFVWEKDQGTYLFRGNLFWKLDESTGNVEPGYPKDISESWTGTPEDHIDAVFTSPFDDRTYIMTGSKFWRFNDTSHQVEDDNSSNVSSNMWFSC